MALKNPNKLNDRTPKWFRDWHENHYTSDIRELYNRTCNNKRWIVLIVAAIIAGNFVFGEFGIELLRHLFGG